MITGTPACGKTTISKKLASLITGSELISANSLVLSLGLFRRDPGSQEAIADLGRLKQEINRRIANSNASVIIIEGHLLCDIRIKGATAIVVREHLATLMRRMKRRRYGQSKIEGNIVSEAIDYCGVNAGRNYRNVYEIWSGGNAARDILEIINGRKRAAKEIDLLAEMNGIAKRLNKAVL